MAPTFSLQIPPRLSRGSGHRSLSLLAPVRQARKKLAPFTAIFAFIQFFTETVGDCGFRRLDPLPRSGIVPDIAAIEISRSDSVRPARTSARFEFAT